MFIAVALSGGVDSAVAASLLITAGHHVLGVTARLADSEDQNEQQRLKNITAICGTLAIPLKVYDLRGAFQTQIVANFIQAYLNGLTPSPCPQCNRQLKFGKLWELIRQDYPDCEALATGHYARIIQNADYPENKQEVSLLLKTLRMNNFAPTLPWLLKSPIVPRDQSYMLYNLPPEVLKRVIFPLGAIPKEVVRQKAQSWRLPIADAPDSQDNCFAGDNYRQFVATHLPAGFPVAGNIITTSGEVLGSHAGYYHYTIGQRRGLSLKRQGTENGPLYVTAIRPQSREVVVGSQASLYSDYCYVEQLNWLVPPPSDTFNIAVRIRYNSPEVKATVTQAPDHQRVKVTFAVPQKAVTPGQCAVFYHESLVLGGGIIAI